MEEDFGENTNESGTPDDFEDESAATENTGDEHINSTQVQDESAITYSPKAASSEKTISDQYFKSVESSLEKLKSIQLGVNSASDLQELIFYVSEVEKVHSQQIMNLKYFVDQYSSSSGSTEKLVENLKSLLVQLTTTLAQSKNMQINVDSSLQNLAAKFQTTLENIELDTFDEKLFKRLDEMVKNIPLNEFNALLTNVNKILKHLSESSTSLAGDAKLLEERVGRARVEINSSVKELHRVAEEITPKQKVHYGLWFFAMLFFAGVIGLTAGYFSANKSMALALTDIKKENITMMSEYQVYIEDKQRIKNSIKILQSAKRLQEENKKLKKYFLELDGALYLKFSKTKTVKQYGTDYLVPAE